MPYLTTLCTQHYNDMPNSLNLGHMSTYQINKVNMDAHSPRYPGALHAWVKPRCNNPYVMSPGDICVLRSPFRYEP